MSNRLGSPNLISDGELNPLLHDIEAPEVLPQLEWQRTQCTNFAPLTDAQLAARELIVGSTAAPVYPSALSPFRQFAPATEREKLTKRPPEVALAVLDDTDDSRRCVAQALTYATAIGGTVRVLGPQTLQQNGDLRNLVSTLGLKPTEVFKAVDPRQDTSKLAAEIALLNADLETLKGIGPTSHSAKDHQRVRPIAFRHASDLMSKIAHLDGLVADDQASLKSDAYSASQKETFRSRLKAHIPQLEALRAVLPERMQRIVASRLDQLRPQQLVQLLRPNESVWIVSPNTFAYDEAQSVQRLVAGSLFNGHPAKMADIAEAFQCLIDNPPRRVAAHAAGTIAVKPQQPQSEPVPPAQRARQPVVTQFDVSFAHPAIVTETAPREPMGAMEELRLWVLTPLRRLLPRRRR